MSGGVAPLSRHSAKRGRTRPRRRFDSRDRRPHLETTPSESCGDIAGTHHPCTIQPDRDTMAEMPKNFDAWNEQKKVADGREIASDFFFHERELWWCALGANMGVEADGKHDLFERPVLIA